MTAKPLRAEQLRTKYRKMWASGERSLRLAEHEPSSIPSHGDRGWGLSLVLLIEGSVRDELRSELDALALLRRAPHLVYAPEHLHSTIRSLEGFQDEVPASQVEHYADQLRRVAAGLPPMEVEYTGMSGSAGGIFACGYPSESLVTLRRRLHEDQFPVGPLGVESPDANFIRDTAHVSLMVYRPPLQPENAIADYVSGRADTYFGTVSVTGLSLVRYRPTPASVCLVELARISL